MPMHGFGFFGGYSWIMVIINLLVMVAFLIIPILLVTWAVRKLGNHRGETQGNLLSYGKTAKDILQERYAKGEIDHDEYNQILSDLSK